MSPPYAATADELQRAHTLSHPLPGTPTHLAQDALRAPAQASAVSWGAVLAGAAGAAALSLILLVRPFLPTSIEKPIIPPVAPTARTNSIKTAMYWSNCVVSMRKN